ncbi:MAG: 1-acyl-sn-glycerol-3-phosphate acyltransferase [Clostridiales bacterium]|nr:1-acyl-sn-glycerol-3-phosphate acyltransferase [Clostridiales bacterium]
MNQLFQKKVVYYTDELQDDFAITRNITKPKEPTGGRFYESSSFVKKPIVWLLYRAVATPVCWIYSRVFHGVRVKNRSVILKLRGGCFLYGNHTQNVIDAFLPTIAAFPKRCDVITARDAVSLPVIKHVVPALGGVPLPETYRDVHSFMESIRRRLKKGHAIAIYPEAHIWPYYNKIRPFSEAAFTYPCRFGVPAVPFTVTYRKRKILSFLPPVVTVVIGEPVLPDASLGKKEAMKQMRDAVYEQMCRAAEESYAHIEYVKRDMDANPIYEKNVE